MKNKKRLYNLIIVITLLISACNLPRNVSEADAASTAAAQTIQAILSVTPTFGAVNTPTVTPGVVPATLTPIPILTNTPFPSATSNCNVMQFVTDVTYADDSVLAPGQNFTKTWRIKNVGTCAWTPSYAVVFSNGNSMNGPSTQALAGNVNPGQTLDVSVNLTAPASPDTYRGDWKIRDASGVLFGAFYVKIKVQNAVTPTNTTGPAAFAVTNVVFTVTGTCPNFSYTYSITTNGAGTVNLHRIFSDGGTDATPVTMIFSAAGTQTSSPISVFMGTPATTTWTDIYIDSPNHQQFGRASFTCP